MTTERSSLSTGAALRRALQEAPIIARRLWVVLLLNLGGTAVQILVPVVVQVTIDRSIRGTGTVDLPGVMTAVSIGFGIIVLGAWMTRAGLARIIHQATTGMSQLRVRTFEHLMRRSVLHVQSERRGALVSRVTSDVQTLQEFMGWGGVMMLVNGTQVLVAIVVMAVYEWRLTLLVLFGTVVYAASLLWFQRILRRRYDSVRTKVAESLGAMSEAVNALPTVRAHGAEDVTQARVDEALEERFRAEFRAMHFGNMLFATAEIFAAAVTAGVIVAGLLLGTASGVTAGVLLAFLFLVNMLIAPIQMLVEILDFAQSAASGVRRIAEAIDAPVEIPETEDAVTLRDGSLGVAFEDVGFTYEEGPEVLTDVSVHIDAGRRVAVVGETGSGKTTFAKLLVRLLEVGRGAVRIGGVDVRDVSFDSLRDHVAFVPQEGFLFTGTVADNVRYGDLGATDEQVLEAFHELGLDDWLATLPDGIHTATGERGSGLSAGEKQLVALVRAWISDPDLLLLDEATSAVDPALDVALRGAMERLTEGRTSVTIAHRLATAEAADEVLVFDRGRLVEQGPHEELTRAGGVYASLYQDWAAGTAVV